MPTKAIRALGACAILAASATALSAQSEPKCGERDKLITELGQKFGEQLSAGGLTGPTKLLEIWNSEDTGSWTILQTDADGQSCIVASGSDWVDFPAAMMSMMGEKS